MKKFKDFNINTATKNFIGEKIKMYKILDREISVHEFRLEDSKIFKDRGSKKCLHLQIGIGEVKHVVFTSSVGLIDAINQIPLSNFPFLTTIVKINDRFEFT